jgi:hypothetical protein
MSNNDPKEDQIRTKGYFSFTSIAIFKAIMEHEEMILQNTRDIRSLWITAKDTDIKTNLMNLLIKPSKSSLQEDKNEQ